MSSLTGGLVSYQHKNADHVRTSVFSSYVPIINRRLIKFLFSFISSRRTISNYGLISSRLAIKACLRALWIISRISPRRGRRTSTTMQLSMSLPRWSRILTYPLSGSSHTTSRTAPDLPPNTIILRPTNVYGRLKIGCLNIPVVAKLATRTNYVRRKSIKIVGNAGCVSLGIQTKRRHVGRIRFGRPWAMHRYATMHGMLCNTDQIVRLTIRFIKLNSFF